MINVLHEFFMTLNWKMMLWMYNRKLTECVTFWLVSEETGLSISDFSMVGAYKTTIFVPCKLKFRSHGDIWPYSWGKVPGKGGWLFFSDKFQLYVCVELYFSISCHHLFGKPKSKIYKFLFCNCLHLGEKRLVKNAMFIFGGKFYFLNATFHVTLSKDKLIQIHKDLNNYKYLFSEMGPENGL